MTSAVPNIEMNNVKMKVGVMFWQFWAFQKKKNQNVNAVTNQSRIHIPV